LVRFDKLIVAVKKLSPFSIALILRFIKPIEMMKLKTWPGGQGF